ncbi:MAG: hypothetical protein JNL83_15770 [Myxococcales bacterium]|nr:hypothetical protein [Myxococcales bacterium]
MATKRCPNCNLVNPGSGVTCDCGYSFSSGTLGRPLDLSKPGDPAPMTAPHASNLPVRVLIWLLVVAAAVVIKVALRR